MSSTKMSELISTLVDGEAKLTENDIEKIKSDPEAIKKWSNYHLIKNVIQDTAPTAIPKDFAANVMHAIANEPVVLAPSPRKVTNNSWFRPAAGFAVAATVALATIGGLQNLWQAPSTTQELVSVELPNVTNSSNATVVASSLNNGPSNNAIGNSINLTTAAPRVAGVTLSNQFNSQNVSDLRWKRLDSPQSQAEQAMADKKMAQELNRLLMNHVRSAGTMQGMLPYARLAGYDEE